MENQKQRCVHKAVKPRFQSHMKKYNVTLNLYKHLGYNYASYDVVAENPKKAEKEARRLHKEAIKTNYQLQQYNIGEVTIKEIT